MNDLPLANFRDACKAYETAAKELLRATYVAFPAGAVIEVTIHHRRIRGQVVYADQYHWSQPSRVCVENLKTGKRRCFDAVDSATRPVFVSLPNKGGAA